MCADRGGPRRIRAGSGTGRLVLPPPLGCCLHVSCSGRKQRAMMYVCMHPVPPRSALLASWPRPSPLTTPPLPPGAV